MHSRDRVYASISTLAVLAGIAAGFVMLGSPGNQRNIEADRRRVQDLQSIARSLHSRKDAGRPSSLADAGLRQTDPVTRSAYEYRRIEGTKYELCANFATDTLNSNDVYPIQFWRHNSGRHCFTLDAMSLPQY